MAITGTFDARGPHRALGRVALELQGGLLALHHAHAARQGSIYWPRAACEMREDAGSAALTVHGADAVLSYELAPHPATAIEPLRRALEDGPTLPEGGGPRRPVQLDHPWPFAAPWQSVRQLARELNRPARLALPLLVPYAWLQLRREARRHPPEAIRAFHEFALGDFAAARASLRAALAAFPTDYDAFYLYLHTFLREFAFEDALACAAEFGMEAKLRVSHLDNDIRLLQEWHAERHDALFYRETKDREGIGLIGQHGTALTMLRPAGKVRVGERDLSARTDGEFAAPGVPVEVVGWDGVSLLVRPLASPEVE